MFSWLDRLDLWDALLLGAIAMALFRLRRRAGRRRREARQAHLDRLRVG